jgi:hypothetical protein
LRVYPVCFCGIPFLAGMNHFYPVLDKYGMDLICISMYL